MQEINLSWIPAQSQPATYFLWATKKTKLYFTVALAQFPQQSFKVQNSYNSQTDMLNSYLSTPNSLLTHKAQNTKSQTIQTFHRSIHFSAYC